MRSIRTARLQPFGDRADNAPVGSTRRTNQAGVPSWMYLIGVVSILFVIYIWQAPLDWFTEFVTSRVQQSVTPPTTTTLPSP